MRRRRARKSFCSCAAPEPRLILRSFPGGEGILPPRARPGIRRKPDRQGGRCQSADGRSRKQVKPPCPCRLPTAPASYLTPSLTVGLPSPAVLYFERRPLGHRRSPRSKPCDRPASEIPPKEFLRTDVHV